MNSFELIYEAEEDVLEVTFEVVDDNFSRTITLNEEIVLHTDSNLDRAWGITFYSYAKLLQANETDLDELLTIDLAYRNKILALITAPPISHFLHLLDSEHVRAMVRAPRLSDIM